MRPVRIANRYARSLLLIASEKEIVDAVKGDMENLDSLSRTHREFRILINSPVVKTDKKIAIFREIFGENFHPVSMAFIELITRKGRESYLDGIAQSFVRQYREGRNIKLAEVKSAIGLDKAQQEEVLKRLQQIAGTEVETVFDVDADLIGGLIVRIEDREYNGALSYKLNKLRRDFSQNIYISKI